jgi:hypothetical protein
MNDQELQPKGEKAHPSGTASSDKSSPRLRSGGRLLKSLPWAWIALSGFATLVWFAAIGWVAVKLFRWVAD